MSPPSHPRTSGHPTPPQSLSENLSSIARATLARTEEGQRIFHPIATLWDSYLQSEDVRKLPAHLRKPLAKLCNEITSIANTHFESYIKGTHAGPSNSSLPTTLTPPAPTRLAQTCPPATYARVTAAKPPPPTPQARKQPTKSAKTPPARPDTRLFVRIGPEHPARAAGSFALLTGLKTSLGANAHLLKEVLEVPSGFALCTNSIEALATLEKHSDLLSTTISNCKVERQHPWVTYRADNIPRSVRLLDPLSQVQNHLVTDQILFEAVSDTTNQRPIKAAETRNSLAQGLFSTSWSINFLEEGHKPMPRTLRILGTTVHLHLVIHKPKTVQCTSCFQWHNARCCSRRKRCRTCGSYEHTEEGHTTTCTAILPHQCPAKCLHCRGPHPADDPDCPLRLIPLYPKTKSQKDALVKAGRAAHSRAVLAAKCCKTPLADVSMDCPRTPTRNRSHSISTAPTTTTAPRFYAPETPNRFTALCYAK